MIFGKHLKATILCAEATKCRKKSILFNLSYWMTHKMPHNVDVMHVKKNICNMLLGNFTRDQRVILSGK